MTCDRVGGFAQVSLREQVGVDVVVGDRAVLVGAGDAVDAEASLRIVMTERTPESGGLDEELETNLGLEVVVLRRRLVPGDGVCDVGVDVERGCARGPVAGALLTADRAPGEGGASEAELARSVPRQI